MGLDRDCWTFGEGEGISVGCWVGQLQCRMDGRQDDRATWQIGDGETLPSVKVTSASDEDAYFGQKWSGCFDRSQILHPYAVEIMRPSGVSVLGCRAGSPHLLTIDQRTVGADNSVGEADNIRERDGEPYWSISSHAASPRSLVELPSR